MALRTFDVISPGDGSRLLTREYASHPHIEKALEKSHRAYQSWRRVPLDSRAACCRAFVDHFVKMKSDIAPEITRQMGRPIRYAAGEVGGFEARARYMIGVAHSALADIKPAPETGFDRFIQRVPLGIVLVVAPWNYPYLTSVNAVIPAMMAGNSVLLKHSSQTPLCAERFAECAEAAGLPDGVFQFLHLDHAGTAMAAAHPLTAHVCFTGSVEGGASLEKSIAGQFKSAGLELGGKDPAYVRHDADMNQAVETLVDGAFFNSGQSCCGIERIYVHRNHYDEFLQRAIDLAGQYRLGDPLDPESTLGPMVRTSAADAVRQQIAEALAGDAQALMDESRFPMSRPGTPYLAPQILIATDSSMRIETEETFGPVVTIHSVHDDDEAIARMNQSQFGLTAAIFTRDIQAGIQLGQDLETGTVFVNRCDYLDPALAWVGVKKSGRGCTLSSIGYEYLTRPRSFHARHLT